MTTMKATIFSAVAASLLFFCAQANAQHLWWDLQGQGDATCLYGEITVLATAPNIYYCGANWHPGEPAGGYCGIQHNGGQEHRTIFSIWDTAPKLHPTVTEADAATIFSRFGGEGEGAHTHMLWDWKVGDTFQFFVQKTPGVKAGSTDARYYVFDRQQEKWRHSATIGSPDGGKKSVATLGGGLNSFLENFSGRDHAVPKLALYRLWLGPSVKGLKCLTKAGGDGTWGQLHGAYFLAEGDVAALRSVFARLQDRYGRPLMAEKGKALAPLADIAPDKAVIEALQHLPRAKATK
jgi:hypothetical protein